MLLQMTISLFRVTIQQLVTWKKRSEPQNIIAYGLRSYTLN